jgi:fructose-bisphosphate aldolase class II
VTLVSTGDLVRRASEAGSAVLAFNLITLEHAEAIVIGAESTGAAVILQVSQNAVTFHGGRVGPVTAAAARLATNASVDLALHLDHVEDFVLLQSAADAGFSSVMFDAGRFPYAENVEATRVAAQWAHDAGLWIEAELGYVGGKPGSATSAHAEGVRTDPAEAVDFLARTGVDALAVAVGSSHAMTTRSASLDHDLIRRLRKELSVPLVLHGSSGVPDEELRFAAQAGMSKINVGTALNIAYTATVREILAIQPDLVDPRRYLTAARASMAEVVRHLTTLFPPIPPVSDDARTTRRH